MPHLSALLRASLLALAALTASRFGPARAQEPPPPITMTLESPLARPDSDALAPSSDDPNNPEKPLAIVARFGKWFPVAVRLANTGEDARVSLSMRLLSTLDPSSVGSVSTFETSVDLPRGSNKRVWMYGRLERGACDAGEISLSGSGVSGLRRTFALSSPSDGARVVWTVSDTDERLSFLNNLSQLRASVDPSIANQALGNGRAVETLGATHEMVPSRWIGLDGVDLVVLHDFPHTALASDQIEALRGYVAGGGSMLVLGGSNTSRLAASPLREMWPMQPNSSRPAYRKEQGQLVSLLSGQLKRAFSLSDRLSGTSGPSLPQNLLGPRNLNGADKLGGAPILVATGATDPSARALSPKLDEDLAWTKRYGTGRVSMFAFDPTKPPFVGWRGQEALWKLATSQIARPKGIAGVDPRLETQSGDDPSRSYSYNSYNQSTDVSMSSLRSALARSPQLRTPSASSIAWFLALYVFFLVPVNYVLLRAVDRRELAWVTVPLIVLAFSTLSYAAAVRIKGTQLRARQVAIVQGTDSSPRARADSMLWVFSPRKAAYSIRARGEDSSTAASSVAAVYGDGRRSDALDNSLVRERTEGSGAGALSVEGVPINMWDYKSFVGHSVAPTARGFSLQMRNGKKFVTNNSGHKLRAAAWVEKGRIYSLGDIDPSERVEIPSSKSYAPSSGGMTYLSDLAAPVYAFDNAGTGRGIATAALQMAGFDASKPGIAPMLIAWQRPDEAVTGAALEIEGEAAVRETVTLWVWRFSR